MSTHCRTDPHDDRILECAVAAGADTVVTGDGHLLSVAEFLANLEARSR